MKLMAMSRRFPPDYKRRWFIAVDRVGNFVVRYHFGTLIVRNKCQSLTAALDYVMK